MGTGQSQGVGIRAIPGLAAALLVGGALLLVLRPDAPGFAGRETQAPPPFPASLAETGLYSDFAAKTVGPANLAYSPQYPLWSDGATKRRWIRLPPGTAIDAADPDVWIFPAGTKLWKEFSFGGKPVETRLIESLGGGVLRFAAYVWNPEGTEATLAPASGLPDFIEIAPGIRHDIPGVYDCRACHRSRVDEVLGFSALQLSPDRDPDAPHAQAVLPGMVNLASVIARGLIVHAPASWADRPLRIRAATETARASLGTMHANCGNCHNVNTPLVARGLVLRYSAAPGADGAAGVLAAIGEPSSYPIPGVGPGEARMIDPGHPERSAVVYRMSTRNPLRQMPPLGTKIADKEAVELITRWIREGAAAGSRRER